MEKKLSAKDLGIDLTPKCKYCGEKLNTAKVENYSAVTFDLDSNNIHVCDPEKITQFRRDFNDFIRHVKKEQSEILKMKDIDENQLKKSFNI